MNAITITSHIFLDAVKHRYKTILASTVVFALVGAGIGVWYAPQGAAPAKGEADSLPQVGLFSIEESFSYFEDCLEVLTNGLNNCNVYLKTALSESSITKEERENFVLLQEEIEKFTNDEIYPIRKILQYPQAIYIPQGLWSEYIEELESDLGYTRLRIISAKEASSILSTMDAPAMSENESIIATYNAILQDGANYGPLLQQEETLKDKLIRLKEQKEEILSDTMVLEDRMEKSYRKLNVLLEKVSREMDKFAKEKHLIFEVTSAETLLPAKKNETVYVTLTHTHAASTKEEIFTILVLFSTLVGLCSGCFFAVCEEGKNLLIHETIQKSKEKDDD